MSELSTPYLHIEHALAKADIEFLKDACKQHLSRNGIPCYALINSLDTPAYVTIKQAVEQRIGEQLYYLNDFYIYTDSSFKTNWHMDTELFSFDRAINAWILLSPDLVDDPLGFVHHVNDSSDQTFHSVRMEGDRCCFGNYFTGATMMRSLAAIEAEQIHTPRISVGDILLFDPKRFHKTNVNRPKHAISFKFILKGRSGFLSTNPVDPYFWPEVDIFTKLVKGTRTWEEVIEGIRNTLKDDTGRESLSAGFYPEKFDLYRRMVSAL